VLPATLTNPNFLPWTAPAAVAEADRQAVQEAVRTALAGKPAEFGLTRLSDGSTAIVVSPGNAGVVHEWGVEVGLSGWLTREISLSGSYAYFGFDVREQLDVLEANTPKHRGTASVNYEADIGLDLQLLGRFVDGYRWAAGIFRGYVPSSVTTDASAGYQVSRQVRVHAVATDLFDRKQFQFYGGAVEGRRILGGVTVTF
jgi:outer membrane receptor protein involved in Fe transport